VSGTVFANGLEVSAKQSDNESIAAMPDVCLSPPSPPAGPIPIPYPNFSQASDTTDGTKTVKIAGDEVGMKNQSSYKTSKGDEAATKSLGMGVNTATIQGKTFFAAWSSDVMFEGANAVRFTDMTTHNHANPATSGATTASLGKPTALSGDAECVKLELELQRAETNDTVSGKVNDGEVLATANHSTQGMLKAASSDAMIKPSASAGYCPRPTDPAGGEPKVACTNDRYNSSRGGGGHAEGRVIQKVFSSNPPAGSTLTFRIRWQDGGMTRDQPCKDCKGAICKAAVECGWKIQFCVREGNDMKKKSAPCRRNKNTGRPYWKGKLRSV
jgi:hypothetical protein